MKKIILTSVFSLFLLTIGFSQSDEVKNIVVDISTNLNDVSTSKDTYNQSIESISPTVVKYRREELKRQSNNNFRI